MSKHVCPWWLAYTFDNPLRRLFHDPLKIFDSYIRDDMTVLDIGCGMGYFSIGMARMLSEKGVVLAVDLQKEMLEILEKRAQRAGVANRIHTRLCKADSIEVMEKVDFALAFWVAHEVPETGDFFSQVRSVLNPDGKFLIAEPLLHVSANEFARTLESAIEKGFTLIDRPRIFFSRTALFLKE